MGDLSRVPIESVAAPALAFNPTPSPGRSLPLSPAGRPHRPWAPSRSGNQTELRKENCR